MNEWNVALLAGIFILFALVSQRLDRAAISMPMYFVGAGVVADATGLIDLAPEHHVISLLGEVTLAVILFSDAARINLGSLRRNAGIPARLLLIGLPLTILLGAVLLAGIFPDSSLAEVALIAAILAPTDAALGAAVVENPVVPSRVRQALNVESGVNDGLALPAVTMLIAITLGEDDTGGFWLRFVARQIGLGVAVGATVGLVVGWLVLHARRAGWINTSFGRIAMISVAILAFAVAEGAEANGFIAAFVAGLTVGTVLGLGTTEQLDGYAEDSGRFLAALTFFFFGNIFVVAAFENVTVRIAVAALVILTIVRMVPVAIAVADRRLAWQTVVFIGWFGPRGLASMLFGLLLFDEQIPRAEEFFGVITVTIVASVVFHGVTAGWGAQRFGAWSASNRGSADTLIDDESDAPRTRWSDRR